MKSIRYHRKLDHLFTQNAPQQTRHSKEMVGKFAEPKWLRRGYHLQKKHKHPHPTVAFTAKPINLSSAARCVFVFVDVLCWELHASFDVRRRRTLVLRRNTLPTIPQIVRVHAGVCRRRLGDNRRPSSSTCAGCARERA